MKTILLSFIFSSLFMTTMFPPVAYRAQSQLALIKQGLGNLLAIKPDEPPGQSGEAPGQSGESPAPETPASPPDQASPASDSPGQSGESPGQSGTAPGQAEDQGQAGPAGPETPSGPSESPGQSEQSARPDTPPGQENRGGGGSSGGSGNSTPTQTKLIDRGCVDTSVRPCYDRVVREGAAMILSLEAGEKAFRACSSKNSPGLRSSGEIKTALLESEIYQYCFEGKSTVQIRQFIGSSAEVEPLVCSQSPGFGALASLGSSLDNQGQTMETMLELQSGVLLAGGWQAIGSGRSAIMRRSTDDGKIWKTIELPTAYGSATSSAIYTLAEDQNAVIYAGGQGFWRSVDAGATWTALLAPYYPINYLIITKDNALVAAFDSGVSRSIDGGNTWDQLFTLDEAVTSIIEATDGALVFRTYSTLPEKNSVYHYSDGLVTETFPYGTSIIEPKIELLKARDGAILLLAPDAATDIRNTDYAQTGNTLLTVYKSVDNGLTWDKIGALPNSWTTQGTIIEGANETMYAVSYSICDEKSAVYKSKDRGVTWSIAAIAPDSFEISSILEVAGRIIISGNAPTIFWTQ